LKSNLHKFLLTIIACGLFIACTNRADSETPIKNIETESSDVVTSNSTNTVTAKTHDTASVAGVNYTLKNTSSGCSLIAENDKIFELDLEENCKFHRLENSEVQVVKGHHGPAFLIMSVKHDKEKGGCQHRIITVTVANNETYIDPIASTGAACWGKFPLDDIYFLAPRFEGLSTD